MHSVRLQDYSNHRSVTKSKEQPSAKARELLGDLTFGDLHLKQSIIFNPDCAHRPLRRAVCFMSSIYKHFADKKIPNEFLCQDALRLKYWSESGYVDTVQKWLDGLK